MEVRTDPIKAAFERKQRALRARPYLGQGTATTRVRLLEGLQCSVEEGDWRLLADMSPRSGGDGAGPNPGMLGRGALAACLAMTTRQWAAYLDVPLESLEVEVQADYDARGAYDFPDISPAYSEVRYVLRIQSPAPEATIRQLLQAIEQHTPYLDVFRHPQPLVGRWERLSP